VERKVAHNAFVSVTVELGLIGLAIFLGVVALAAAAALAQPRWELRLWLAVLATWSVGALALTWENRKPTWLFFSLIVVGAGLRHSAASPVSGPSSATPPSPPQTPSSPARADRPDELHPDMTGAARRGAAPTV